MVTALSRLPRFPMKIACRSAPGSFANRLAHPKIAPDRERRPLPDRNDPLLAPLAEHLDLVAQQVEGTLVEHPQFRQPEPRGVEQLQHREIAQGIEVILLGL